MSRGPTLALVLLLGAVGARAQEVFVAPAQVAAQLDAGGLVVLDVGRPDSSWARARLPGARRVPFAALVVTRDGIPNELPPVARLDSVFESLGVGDETPVLIYGEPLTAARAWVTLDLLGHRRARLLDGGLARWQA
ncbi:MAG: rhodanese-like domain-containing protein, partial [Gemmatimonadales bacterium]|nr:rhodanese-like domain-containing protein [Gemmatimonadales bacterium]